MKSHKPKELLLCNYIDSTTSLETLDSSRLSRDSILDNLASSETKAEIDKIKCPNLEQKYVICSRCDSFFSMELDCHKKDCEVCQRKRGWKLHSRSLRAVDDWENYAIKEGKEYRIQHLTLTRKNVPEITLDYIKESDKLFNYFLDKVLKRKGVEIKSGFWCKECTYHKIGDSKFNKKGKLIGYYSEKDYGYHYHYHVLFYAPIIDLKEVNISALWKKLTKDSFQVKLLNKFKNNQSALWYLMKYVVKTQTHGDMMSNYYLLTKQRMNFRAFGKNCLCKCNNCVYNRDLRDRLKIWYKPQYKELYKKYKLTCIYNIKTPFLCSSCGSEFKKNPYKRYSVFYDQLPNNYELKLVKILNRKRIKYIISIQETKQETKQEILSKIALNKHIFRQKNNWEFVEALFTVAEIKYHLERGDIFETKEGYKLLE